MLKISKHGDQMLLEIMKGRKCYNLQRMAVNPLFQHRGYGTKSLKKSLLKADSENLPVFLSTNTAKNVIFYSRLGFVLIKKCEFPFDDDEAHSMNYFMIREPNSPYENLNDKLNL